MNETLRERYIPAVANFDPRQYGWSDYLNRKTAPWKHLDNIGISRICEMLSYGMSPKRIAEKIGLSSAVIAKWIEADTGRNEEYQWAFSQYADNAMYDAREIIDDAHPDSDSLKKAALQADHRRHMAKGFGVKRWGNKVDVNQNVNATVSYNFNIGLLPAQKAALEGEARRVEKDSVGPVDINELLGPGIDVVDLSVPNNTGMTYEEASAQEADEAKAAEGRGQQRQEAEG